MPRLVRARGIGRHRNYTVAEASAKLAVHPNTVLLWIKEGLPVVGGRRPHLILGADLIEFLSARNARRKRPLGPGEIYCVACHGPKRPAGDLADLTPTSANGGTLLGICPDCDRIIRRHVSWTSLDEVLGGLEITVAGGEKTLRHLPRLPVFRDLRKVKKP